LCVQLLFFLWSCVDLCIAPTTLVEIRTAEAMTARRRSQGNRWCRRRPPRHVLSPVGDVQAVEIPGKGRGVAARRELPANGRLAYVGQIIDQAAMERLCERAKREPARRLTEYLMAEGRAGFYIDAHPRLPERRSSWIGGLVNEPAPGETANMVIGRQRFGHDNRLRPVFITVRHVREGEELTVNYGRAYTRAYIAGRAPIKPAWL
jgi:hypothetical protein